MKNPIKGGIISTSQKKYAWNISFGAEKPRTKNDEFNKRRFTIMEVILSLGIAVLLGLIPVSFAKKERSQIWPVVG